MKQYKFLLFDLDYTLLDFDADMTMAFEKLYESCGFHQVVPYSAHMLDLYESFNSKWWRIFESGECTKPQLFRNRFVDFLEASGLSADPDRMNADYFEFLGTGGVAYPGALEMLDFLCKEHDLYIITNGNASTARTRIANSGVGRYIKGYFVSEAIGFAKPDLRYFDYAFSHIPGFCKEQAVVIGDSFLSDITGAVNAGVDSIWYHPPGRAWEKEKAASATYHAESFREILSLLDHAQEA